MGMKLITLEARMYEVRVCTNPAETRKRLTGPDNLTGSEKDQSRSVYL